MTAKILLPFILLIGLLASPAAGMTLYLDPLFGGHDERVDAPDPCITENSFLAGVAMSETALKVGGNSYGCDSEWAAGFQFDLSEVPTGQQINSALLIVRKTGYADGAAGFAVLGAYSYTVTGSPVSVPRADLTPETALDIVTPPAANVDMEFDITDAVQQLVDDGEFNAGILLSGIYSEAGYLSYITVGNASHSIPPQLIVQYDEGTVPTQISSWDTVKSLFRP